MVFTGAYHVIATGFNLGISVAVSAAVLCINRRLYLLASLTSIIPSKADKNREVIIDLVIGIGLPIILMVLCLSSPSNLSLYLFGSSILSVLRSNLSMLKSVLILSEIGFPSSFFTRHFPILGKNFGVDALGLNNCLIVLLLVFLFISYHLSHFL